MNIDIPAELEKIIFKCLEKDVKNRYQTTDQLLIGRKNLKLTFDSGTDVIPQVVHRPKKFIRLALITLSIFTALITTIYYALFYERIKEPRVVNVRPLTRTTAISEDGSQISSDGSCVAHWCTDETGNCNVWVRQIASDVKIKLTQNYEGLDEGRTLVA